MRSARYRFRGSALNGARMRCDTTTCMTSPSLMYWRARSTALQNPASPNSDTAAPPGAGPESGIVNGRRNASSNVRQALAGMAKRQRVARIGVYHQVQLARQVVDDGDFLRQQHQDVGHDPARRAST